MIYNYNVLRNDQREIQKKAADKYYSDKLTFILLGSDDNSTCIYCRGESRRLLRLISYVIVQLYYKLCPEHSIELFLDELTASFHRYYSKFAERDGGCSSNQV